MPPDRCWPYQGAEAERRYVVIVPLDQPDQNSPDRARKSVCQLINGVPVEHAAASVAGYAEWGTGAVVTESEQLLASVVLHGPGLAVVLDNLGQRPHHEPLSGLVEHTIAHQVQPAQARRNCGSEQFLGLCDLGI
jgi:hypothetical protein